MNMKKELKAKQVKKCSLTKTNISINEIAKQYSNINNITFQKNGGNIFGNANISLGFVFSKPNEFLWILSDNDIVAESAVDYILENLDSNIDFYCFNYSVTEPTTLLHDWQNGWVKPMEWRMGLISDALYNVNTVTGSMDDAFFYHNSSFPHLAVACSAAKRKGVVKFMLLPRNKVSCKDFHSSEWPADYSMGQICLPFLAALFPRKEAKKFIRGWLLKHWWDLYLKRNGSIRHVQYHDLFLQSKVIIRKYGGIFGKVFMTFSYTLYITMYPFYKVKKWIIKKTKIILPSKAIDAIRRFKNTND